MSAEPARRFLNSAGKPVNERGEILTGTGFDSAAYASFYRTWRRLTRGPRLDGERYTAELEALLQAMEQITDAGELENAEQLLHDVRTYHDAADPLGREYAEALHVRYAAEEFAGDPDERERVLDDALAKLAALADDASTPEIKLAISSQARTLAQLRLGLSGSGS